MKEKKNEEEHLCQRVARKKIEKDQCESCGEDAKLFCERIWSKRNIFIMLGVRDDTWASIDAVYPLGFHFPRFTGMDIVFVN